MPEIQTVTFNYTGSVQTWTVPNGVRQVTIDCYGAEGGRSNFPELRSPGKGGRARATFQVTPGETLYIYVGGRGEFRASGGGWNGGGQPRYQGGVYHGSGGGGASDVRRGGNTLNHRIIVAGGGGGAGAGSTPRSDGGHGGGLVGESGKLSGNPHSAAGGGGTQTAGGAGGRGSVNGLSGSFGYGGDVPPDLHTGAGGGGWYGGGSGGESSDGYFAGGGGSGYIAPEGINPYFETGVRSGHGLVIITYEVIPPLYVRVNGQLRESESIHVKVNGQLREVDRIWTRVNGQIREV